MLKEHKNTKQIPGDPFRRWFSGISLDLIVWYNDERNSIIGFQFCYSNEGKEKALTWSQDKGYAHNTVDDGEERSGKHKMSPILIPDGIFPSQSVLELFQARSKHLEPGLVEFISHKIREYPLKIN